MPALRTPVVTALLACLAMLAVSYGADVPAAVIAAAEGAASGGQNSANVFYHACVFSVGKAAPVELADLALAIAPGACGRSSGVVGPEGVRIRRGGGAPPAGPSPN